MSEYDKEEARKTIEIKQAIEFVKDIKRAISYHGDIVTSLVKIPAERVFNLDTILKVLEGKTRNDLVKHGEWETCSDRPDRLICSVCDCGFDMWKHDRHNYCPNCGAKMDGGKENE